MKTTKILAILVLRSEALLRRVVLVLVLGLTAEVAEAATNNQAPIADAGLPRYAAQDPVVLDGTGS